MNRRIRFLGAILALVALSAYFAESVRAWLCLPGMDMNTTVEAYSDGHAGMNHTPAQDSEPTRGVQDCPLGMAGMGSSCTLVLLPPVTTTLRAAHVAEIGGSVFVDGLHDRLVATAQFRPPRT